VYADSPRGNIVIFAGGTGGHVYPALAVARELSERGFSVHWFGTERGIESRVVPAADFPLHVLKVQVVRGKGLGSRLRGLWAVFGALWSALVQLRKLHPVCALGMGGYVAGPAGLAAALFRVPLVIHEPNSVAGTTNRLLRRMASRVLVAYPDAFVESQVVEQVGNPVRVEMLQAAADYDFHGDRPLHLLVLGGSQGARAINELLPATLELLGESAQLQVRHQTGAAHSDAVRTAYGVRDGVEVLPFIENMAEAYGWADLVLCRAGALTLAELTIMGLPSLLVPLPGAIDNHQALNAEWLAGHGAARLLPQAELTPELLADMLRQLAANPARLAAMAHAAKTAGHPEATQRVADICQEVQHER